MLTGNCNKGWLRLVSTSQMDRSWWSFICKGLLRSARKHGRLYIKQSSHPVCRSKTEQHPITMSAASCYCYDAAVCKLR